MSNSQASQEALIDSYLKLVGEEYGKKVALEFDVIPETSDYPESLDTWFNDFNKKIKNKIRRKKRKTNYYKYFSGIAAVFVAILIVSTVITLNVEALRVEVLNFFIEEDSESTHIRAGKMIPGDTLLDEYHGMYVLNYVPEGFILDDVMDFTINTRMTYLYQDRRIFFSQDKGEVDIQIDNERSVITEYILPTGESAILSDGDGYSAIIWENNVRTFMISGDVDKEMIIKMAESMSWKE